MTNPKTSLNTFQKDIFSQFGEDGIIEEILKRIPSLSKVCVEFGAWDGLVYSNTANLWFKKGWKAILIEPEPERFRSLVDVTSDFDCICLDTFLTPLGENSLEQVLEKQSIDASTIGLVSIDIDGNEYHIIRSWKTLHPSILIAEYNPTIPPHMEIIASKDNYFGSSARAITNLVEGMGYFLVAVTHTNCIFVREDHAEHFQDVETKLENLFDYSLLTYLITNYQGDYTLSREPLFGLGLSLHQEFEKRDSLLHLNHSQARVKWYRCKDKIKAFLKSFLSREKRLRIRNHLLFIKWIITGMKNPPHYFIKRKILKRYAKDYNIEVFVETGTGGGGTTYFLRNEFKKLYTIEFADHIFLQGKAKLKDEKNIIPLHGDSAEVLSNILKTLDQPALFWLDAHYSGGDTGLADKETPILEELEQILRHQIKSHVILIDDARCFDGSHDYPTIQEVEKLITKTAPNIYKISVERDIIRITPSPNET